MNIMTRHPGLTSPASLRQPHKSASLQFGNSTPSPGNGNGPDGEEDLQALMAKLLDNHSQLTHSFGRAGQARPLEEAKQQLAELRPLLNVAKRAVSKKDALLLEKYARGYSQWGDMDELKTLLGPLTGKSGMGVLASRMGQEGSRQVTEIGKSFLHQYFNAVGVPIEKAEIADGQARAWDLDYLDDLAKSLSGMPSAGPYNYRKAFVELCQSTLKGEYDKYLHDPDSDHGRVNLKTKQAFAEMFQDQGIKLDYDQWMHFPGVVRYKKPSQAEAIQTVQARLTETIRELGNQYGDDAIRGYLAGQGYELDNGKVTSANPNELKGLCRDLQKVLGRNPEREAMPRLEAMLDALPAAGQKMQIRLWDRQPGHDLFQGNYTGACIALGWGNDKGSIEVLQNSFVQLAEFYNEDRQQVTGKALFFWSKDLQSGEPVLIINTFEGRADGCEEDPKSRDELVKFAQQYGKQVAGRPVKIYTADSIWNTLYTADRPIRDLDLQVVGNSASGEYYFDTFGMGRTVLAKPQRNTPIVALDENNGK